MTITLEFQPEIEQGILAQAQARGVSLADYVREIVEREMRVPEDRIVGVPASEARNLVELFANSPSQLPIRTWRIFSFAPGGNTSITAC